MWSDFDIELNRCLPGIHTHDNGYAGDIVRNNDIDAINNSIKNILATLTGTRRMLPSFAQGLYRLLFEQIDEHTAQLIRNNIIAAINKWDDRIIIKSIDVDPIEDQNIYNIRLIYFLKNKFISSKEQEITYILKRLK